MRKSIIGFIILFVLGTLSTVLSIKGYFGNSNASDYMLYFGSVLHGVSMIFLIKFLLSKYRKMSTFFTFVITYILSFFLIIFLGGPYGEFGALFLAVAFIPFVVFTIIGTVVIATSKQMVI